MQNGNAEILNLPEELARIEQHMGHGGSSLDLAPFVRRVVGPNPALAAM